MNKLKIIKFLISMDTFIAVSQKTQGMKFTKTFQFSLPPERPKNRSGTN